MIITKIKLNPFAGLSNSMIKLEKGLNVILGVNETGKSTIANALQNVLFTTVDMTSYQFNKQVRVFLPVGGGDTIKVELQFLHNSKKFVLRKSWGATKSVELVLPGGSVVTDDDTAAEHIQSMLGFTEGTYVNALMTHQSKLAETLEDLSESDDTMDALSDILNKAVLETDGVSVEKLKSRIREMHQEYFDHWDEEDDYPEKGRGIENPWKVRVGVVLRAFYEKEELKACYVDACSFEEKIDEINKKIAGAKINLNKKEKYVKENKAVVEDARQRQLLSAKLETINSKIEQYKEVNNSWPILEKELEKLEKSVPTLKKKQKELALEESAAKRAEKNKTLLEKNKRVCEKKEKLNEVTKQFKTIQKLTNKDLTEIRSLFSTIDKMKASLEAGQIELKFEAKADISLSFKKDFEREEKKTLHSGNTLRVEAGGLIDVKHPDWQMTVKSGSGDFDSIAEELSGAEKALEELFKKHKIRNVTKAEQINQKYQEALVNVNAAEDSLQEELGEETYEEFQKEVKEIKSSQEVRSLAEIVKELTKLESKIEKYDEKTDENIQKLKEFKKKYGQKDVLLLKLAEGVKNQKEYGSKIASLKPLPKKVKDIDNYIQKYELCIQEVEELKEEHSDLLLERAGLEKDMPDESAEALEKQVTEAEDEFEVVKKKADAILRIYNLIMDLSEELDSKPYEGFTEQVQNYISSITSGKYKEIEVEEGLPQGIVRDDGELLTCDLLSTGTRVVLSLSLRLVLSEYFLGDKNGFLVMDDPFVDMDMGRQKKAAKVLQKYAKKKQLIVFTCHPSHAETLGGNLITL